jgi:hypothetical protein
MSERTYQQQVAANPDQGAADKTQEYADQVYGAVFCLIVIEDHLKVASTTSKIC